MIGRIKWKQNYFRSTKKNNFYKQNVTIPGNRLKHFKLTSTWQYKVYTFQKNIADNPCNIFCKTDLFCNLKKKRSSSTSHHKLNKKNTWNGVCDKSFTILKEFDSQSNFFYFFILFFLNRGMEECCPHLLLSECYTKKHTDSENIHL